MYRYGAEWTGADITENQIIQAQRLAAENTMNIDFFISPAEEIDFPQNTFDAITACQCIWYPDHKILVPSLIMLNKLKITFRINDEGELEYAIYKESNDSSTITGDSSEE